MAIGDKLETLSLYESFESYFSKLSNSENNKDLLSTISDFVESIGFRRFLYAGFLSAGSVFTKEEVVISSYPGEWRELYDDKGYSSVDPVVLHCKKTVMPVNWSDVKFGQIGCGQKNAGVHVMNEADAFGLTYGWTIPLHGADGTWSLFSVASSNHNDFFDNYDPRLSLVYLAVSAIHTAITGWYSDQCRQSRVGALTAREREVIAWAAEGKTIWETSMILGVSEPTVRFHLNNVINKMGASNKVSAVSKAILLGVL